MKNTKEIGITLIALVVTIIILLILAGVTIGVVSNNGGLFEKAKLATDEYNNSVEKENTEIGKASNEINSYIDGNRENFYQPMFIDTSRLLHTMATTNYENGTTYSYTATEDCAATGILYGAYVNPNGGSVSIFINDIFVGSVYAGTASSGAPINYYVKKGDTIKFVTGNGKGTGYIDVKIYGLK